MGSVQFEGNVVKDQMCLIKYKNYHKQEDDQFDFEDMKGTTPGKFCVRDLPFVSTSVIVGEFNANGVLGLAPTSTD